MRELFECQDPEANEHMRMQFKDHVSFLLFVLFIAWMFFGGPK